MKTLIIIPALLITLSIIGCGDSNNPQQEPAKPVRPAKAGGFILSFFASSSTDSPGKEETGITEALKKVKNTPPEATKNNSSQLPGTIWVGGDSAEWLDSFGQFSGEKPKVKKSKSGYELSLSFDVTNNTMAIALSCQFSDGARVNPSEAVKVPVTLDGNRVYLQEGVTIQTKSKAGLNQCTVTLMGDYLDFELVPFSDGKKYASIAGRPFTKTN